MRVAIVRDSLFGGQQLRREVARIVRNQRHIAFGIAVWWQRKSR